MAAIHSAFANFLQALSGIVNGIVNSILAVFQAFLALGQELLSGVFQIGQAVLKLAADLTQDVVGFVLGACDLPHSWRVFNVTRHCVANFFLLLVLGGGYYLYSTRQGVRETIKKRT